MNHSTMTIILKTCKENMKILFTLMIIILLAVTLALIPAQLMRLLIDQNLIPKINHNLMILTMIYLLVLIATGFVEFIKGYCLSILGSRLSTKLRVELMAKTKKLPPSYFKNNPVAQTTSRFINDVDSLNSLFKDGVISMVIDSLKIIGILVSVTLFAWQLGVIALLLIPLIYLMTRFFQQRMLKAQMKHLHQLSKVNQHINESLKNMKMLKLFHREKFMEDAYCDCLVDNYKTKESINLYDSLYAPLIQLIRALVLVIIFVAAISDQQVFAISVGKLAASIELISSLLSPIESLGMEITNIQKGLSGIKRLDHFFKEIEESKKDNKPLDEAIFENGIDSIQFKHVSFAYHEKTDIIHDLNLQITPNTSTTFTGRTGVGKSTLFYLILGLYPPREGSIEINGIDVCAIPHHQKRKIFGYVEQQFQFVQGNIATQISLNDPLITQHQIVQACKHVGLHDSITMMEKGYETMIVSGDELSQGQKQLLSIARAIVCDPMILLLDEITANLDSITEAKIKDVLAHVMKDRTLFSITHRLSSLLENERIIHLD